MKIHSTLTINGKNHYAGDDIPAAKIYPFFLIHMLAFGASGFFMAYGAEDLPVVFLFLHGGIAIAVYTAFYYAIFGPDEVRWMYINGLLGVYGVMAQIDWILAPFGKSIGDYSFFAHVIPFTYYVLYTFLIRQMILDVSGARENEDSRDRVEWLYVAGSVVFYTALHLV